MTKRELETKVQAVDASLRSLGDLNTLVQESASLRDLGTELQRISAESSALVEGLSSKSEELNVLIESSKQIVSTLGDNANQSGELIAKVNDLKQETLKQLGLAASEKLSNSFEQVKLELRKESDKWFRYLFGGTIALVIVAAVIAVWQVRETNTLWNVGFLIKIALTSPLVYFIVFVAREYKRVRYLIEEYTFKAAIARSFEAYKQIVGEAFEEQEGDVYARHLDFIIRSVDDLYSSPMRNIRRNYSREKELSPDMLSKVQEILNAGRKE